VLNVVNFGAARTALCRDRATLDRGRSRPYGDSFARPARLLPVEAKALIAAIDLIGEHIRRAP